MFFILLSVVSGLIAQITVEIVIVPGEGEFFAAFLNPLLLILITSGVRYYARGLKLQAQLYEIEAKQIKAELDLLKFQINPHFLFNTLNNLFSMARKHKDQSTATGIAKLSHLMRYMIYESNVDKIELAKEVEQISSFIGLQKLRFSKEDDIKIDFNVNGSLDGIKIIPMLLIPFVENAYKHGVSLNSPTNIQIVLNIDSGNLQFSVKNNINTLKQQSKWDDQNSGIGLKNVKRRLELLYPDSHELEISETENIYLVKLKLSIN